MSMSALLCGALLLAFVTGCDPGFIYKVPGARELTGNGLRYEVDLGDGAVARFSGGAAMIDGYVFIEVLNQGDVPISVAPTPVLITDGNGQQIEPSYCSFRKDTWQRDLKDAQASEIIEKGHSVGIGCNFNPDCTCGLFPPYYPAHTTHVTVVQPGFSRSGRPLDIHATMAAD
jgi:hypothetical protein